MDANANTKKNAQLIRLANEAASKGEVEEVEQLVALIHRRMEIGGGHVTVAGSTVLAPHDDRF